MGELFDGAKIFTGQLATVPQDDQPIRGGGLVSVEQSRAMAEVQAAMVVAKMNPRDENTAFVRIMKACQRKSLAEQASYAYPRGGKQVTGPSIRLAEVAAQAWGNMVYGLREVSRGRGSSEVEAFAWDLESNVKVTRQFQMNHIRDTTQGGKDITGERDVYELVANMGQRRVRACILELIPGDIIDAAEAECVKTLEKSSEPLEDRIRKMLLAFTEFGVTKEMVEARLKHKIEATLPAELVSLQQVYRSIKDGMGKREDFFDMSANQRTAEQTEAAPATTTEDKSKRHRRTKEEMEAERAATKPETAPANSTDAEDDRFWTKPQADSVKQGESFGVSRAQIREKLGKDIGDAEPAEIDKAVSLIVDGGKE